MEWLWKPPVQPSNEGLPRSIEVVMINDCSFVGETLLKYLPSNIRKLHIKRSRGALSKTLGIAYKILKARGDIFHVHYLLQDCYIATRLGKRPLIGHAHGSDVRVALNHPLWGRVVRYNLTRCDKVVVSTPDILSVARRFREDATYLPNPVDLNLFYPRPLVPHSGRRRVLIASDLNWEAKGTDIAVRALSRVRREVDVSVIAYGKDLERTLTLASSLGLRLKVLPKVPHERLSEYYWSADVVLDQFKLGSLGMVSLEAIACGKPVVTYVSSAYEEYKDFPLKDLNSEEDIAEAVLSADSGLWSKEYAYLEKYHRPEVVVEKLLRIYREILP